MKYYVIEIHSKYGGRSIIEYLGNKILTVGGNCFASLVSIKEARLFLSAEDARKTFNDILPICLNLVDQYEIIEVFKS